MSLTLDSLLDRDYYLALYPDVREAIAAGFVKDEVEHYTLYGAAENRSPSSLFDSNYYLALYPDVAEAIAVGFVSSAAEHFALYGAAENRLASRRFDPTYYLALYPDVADAIAVGFVSSAFEHFWLYGQAEGRSGISPLPAAVNDAIATTEDTLLTFSEAQILGNDFDPQEQPLFITGFTQPTNGLLVGNGDGTYTYTPNPNFAGFDTFTYTISDGFDGTTTATVTIAVGAVNDVPIANNDTFTTSEDAPLAIDVATLLANDADVEDGTPTFLSFNTPSNGSLVSDTEGSYLYVPNPNFNGSENLTYTVVDSNGSSASATVTLTIAAVNDLPGAGNDSLTTTEDAPLSIALVDLLANDGDLEDGGTLTIANSTQPSNGTLINDSNGNYLYIPNPDFKGSDSFAYTVSDRDGGTVSAVVSLSVTSVNDLPIATNETLTLNEDETLQIQVADLLSNDGDADGDRLLVTSFTPTVNGELRDTGNNLFTYTPNPDFSGTETFAYTITDGISQNATASATVTLVINAVNDAPVVADDAVTANEDIPLMIDATTLLANDFDVEGEALAIVNFTQPSNGSLMGFGNGTYMYMPNPDYSGDDTFAYTVRDGVGDTSVANVTITVLPDLNTPPVAVNDLISTDEDTAIAINVLTNDTDAETANLAIVSFTPPDQGSVTLGEDNIFTYTPSTDFNGSTSFTYTIRDENNATTTAIVTINIAAVNDAPVLTSSLSQPLAALPVNPGDNLGNWVSEVISPIRSDADADPAGIAVSSVDNTNGAWQYSLDSGNTWTNFETVSDSAALLLVGSEMLRFAPNSDFQGSTTFTFYAWDQTMGSNGDRFDLVASGTGGSTAFSSGTETAAIMIGSPPPDLIV